MIAASAIATGHHAVERAGFDLCCRCVPVTAPLGPACKLRAAARPSSQTLHARTAVAVAPDKLSLLDSELAAIIGEYIADVQQPDHVKVSAWVVHSTVVHAAQKRPVCVYAACNFP